jgi:ABC-type Mn2+/Zn2+ transport system permease subunit
MDHLRILLELFPWSLAAGTLIAALCAAMGIFVILKRVVFIGVALSEAAALGIAAGMVIGFSGFAGAAVLTVAFGLGLSRPYEGGRLPRDAILGILFVSAAALSVLLVSGAGLGLEAVKALLYGDLILTRPADLWIAALVFFPVAALWSLFRRPILFTFLDREAARLLGVRTVLWEAFYFGALALVVAASARVAGALLVFAYLVVAPSAALLASRRLATVLALAVGIAVGCTLLGLYSALALDLPANQLIVALLTLVYLFIAAGRMMTQLAR